MLFLFLYRDSILMFFRGNYFIFFLNLGLTLWWEFFRLIFCFFRWLYFDFLFSVLLRFELCLHDLFLSCLNIFGRIVYFLFFYACFFDNTIWLVIFWRQLFLFFFLFLLVTLWNLLLLFWVYHIVLFFLLSFFCFIRSCYFYRIITLMRLSVIVLLGSLRNSKDTFFVNV